MIGRVGVLRKYFYAQLLRSGLLLLGCVASLRAQVDTGSISGVVSDSTGAVIPGTQVLIAQEETNLQTKLLTNGAGFYSAPALRPGLYQVTALKEGFRAEKKTGIELRVQDHLEVNFQLQLGATTSEITVSAAAPLLESETSSLGQVIDRKTITDLPLNGRNFMQLATLGAGTLPSTRTAERDNFISNGARAVQNSYLLDGVDNKNRIMGFDRSSAQIIQPVLDSIQEFKVQTSTFSAEFGQAAGGVVNVTLKSGTNELHSTLFEFLRNSRLDAMPYFQPPLAGKPVFIQNQFGATMGGPIRKDHTFFFGSWQSSREVNAAPQIGSVPIRAAREGDFGKTPIYDPATTRPNPDGSGFIRDRFLNNIVPRERWDAVAAKLAALYPLPNLPGSVRNFFSNPKERVSNDQYNVRIDHRVGSRDNLFGRLSASWTENDLPSALPDPANNLAIVHLSAQSVALSETHTLRASTVNEFRFAFVRTRIMQDTPAPRRFDEFGIKGALDTNKIRGLPNFIISGLSNLGTPAPGNLPILATGSGNLPSEKWARIFQFLDNVSWVRNRHTFKFGADIQQVTMFVYATNQGRPNFNFNGVYTQNPQARAGSGNAFADFLLGLANDATISTQQLNTIRQRIFQAYAQDDWKVSSKLTLNIGLRYELPKPFIETSDRQANFILEQGPFYGQLLLASDRKNSGLDRSLVGTDYNNFAPRFGLAYRATPKTVVRGGFGVFYGRDENLGILRRLPNNPPFEVRTQFISNQLTPNIVLATGFPPNALDPNLSTIPEVNSFPYDFRTPYVWQWNLNIEHELASRFLAQIGYTGSEAHKLYAVNNLNLPPPGVGNIDARRPFKSLGGIFFYGPLINSNYHALLAKLERRFANGFNLLASYTYGHSIDGGGNQNDMNDPGPQNPRDLRAQRGSSNFDVRHRLVVSEVYELPFGNGKRFLAPRGILSAIAGGWEISGIASAQTGQPFTVTLNFDPTNSGVTARPNRLRDGSLPAGQRGPTHWFDITAFQAPNGPFYGNSGRNVLRGPERVNVDLGLARNFAIRERFRLQFRGEAFNLFNHPQFGIPGATIGAAGAGIIGRVVTPERQIQLALKLIF